MNVAQIFCTKVSKMPLRYDEVISQMIART